MGNPKVENQTAKAPDDGWELEPDFVIFSHELHGYWSGESFDDFNRAKRYATKKSALDTISKDCISVLEVFSGSYQTSLSIIPVY